MDILPVLLIPFAGTVIGSAFVFLTRERVSSRVQNALLGFAAGVMVAASVWSLIMPAIDLSEHLGNLNWMPPAVGIILGTGDSAEGLQSKLGKRPMLMLAVTLHNIPEGMAVGAVIAGALQGNAGITIAAAMALAVGMAIQNIPEGAIISLPLRADGASRRRAFGYGAFSGMVEPISAAIMVLMFEHISPILPYLLAFSAGAMLYVVVEELIPETQRGEHSNIGTIAFAIGFVIMMILDVALG